MTKNNNYHRVLRISSAVVALVLIFQSGLVSQSTSELSSNTQVYLASVIGMSASVQPTDLNQYTAALTQKERDLDEREAALQEREIVIDLSSSVSEKDTVTYILAGVLFILLVLIILNYILDYLRQREAVELKTV